MRECAVAEKVNGDRTSIGLAWAVRGANSVGRADSGAARRLRRLPRMVHRKHRRLLRRVRDSSNRRESTRGHWTTKDRDILLNRPAPETKALRRADSIR